MLTNPLASCLGHQSVSNPFWCISVLSPTHWRPSPYHVKVPMASVCVMLYLLQVCLACISHAPLCLLVYLLQQYLVLCLSLLGYSNESCHCAHGLVVSYTRHCTPMPCKAIHLSRSRMLQHHHAMALRPWFHKLSQCIRLRAFVLVPRRERSHHVLYHCRHMLDTTHIVEPMCTH